MRTRRLPSKPSDSRPPIRQRISWKPNHENESVLRRTQTGGVQKQKDQLRKVTQNGHTIKIEKDVYQSLHREEQDVTTLYIRYGFDDQNTERSILNFLKSLKTLEISFWRRTFNPRHVRKKVDKYRFVKFPSSSTAYYAKFFIARNFNAYVDIARNQRRNNNSCTSPPVQQNGPIPDFTEKEEYIIFHATENSPNFRTRKIKLNEKGRREIYIGSEVGQKIKQSPDNLIFDCPTVSMNHAVILLTKNGLKNRYFLQDLKSTNGTLINNIKTEKETRHPLKTGDIVQFGKKKSVQYGLWLPPIIARVEIIDKEFRTVIIDGCNICHQVQETVHGVTNDKFYVEGLYSAYNCFKNLGYEDNKIHIILKHIPEAQRTRTYSRVIGEFKEKRILTFVPSRHSGPYNSLVKSDDDLFILKTAKEFKGVVLSRDHYRKEKWEHPEYDEIISYRLLQPTFILDKCILPDDPLGPNGPNLKTFLELND